jgi:cation transport ATPase
VTVRRDGDREVSTNDEWSGEIIIIRPGERVPADGP